MKANLINLVVRDSTTATSYDPLMATLLIVLLVLIIVALLCTAGLYYMRYRRRVRRDQGLDLDVEKRSSTRSNHRRVTVRPSESLYVYQEKQNLIANSSSPPSTPVPEIRITFPEELDNGGKIQSGRVVVVHVGENGVALEPFLSSSRRTSRATRTGSSRLISIE